MRQWQICISLHAVKSSQSLLRNKQITSVARLKPLSSVGTTVTGIQGSAKGVIASSVFDAFLSVQRWRKSQRYSILANSSRIELECGTTPT